MLQSHHQLTRWRGLLSAVAVAGLLVGLTPVLPASAAAPADARVYGLTTDYMSGAMGVGIDEPLRFGWKLESSARGLSQKAYRIDVYDAENRNAPVWSSGMVDGAASVGVAHEVSGLERQHGYAWTATVRTSAGDLVTSPTEHFVTEADLSDASWIVPAAQANGISMVRTEQPVQRQVSSAYLYVSAMGVYTAYIDGREVTAGDQDDIFNPGWTDYKYYANYQTYDVGSYIKDRSLTLGIELAKGWYAGRIGSVGNYKASFGPDDSATELGVIAKLVLNYADGTSQTIVTDDDWVSSDHSPVVANDFWDGERYDARIAHEVEGWNDDGYDVSAWSSVAPATYHGELRSSTRATARIADEFDRPAVSQYTYRDSETRSPSDAGNAYGAVVEHAASVDRAVTVKAGDKLIVDFGQNATGVIQLTVNGAAGTTVKIRHAEMLNDGRKNPTVAAGGSDGPAGSLYLTALKGLKDAYDTYVLSDEGTQTWMPSYTFHGFRYVEISADATVKVQSVVAKTFTSVGEETGTFTTNDADINKLVSNTKWSQISNYLSIPTDCPQRDERAGWTGDAQLFAATGVYNYDVYSFFENYNDIMQANAAHNGDKYYAVMPVAYNSAFATVVGSGWSDAGVIIPWVLYQQTGDSTLLRQYYSQMDKYMDYVYTTGYATNRFGDWLAFSGATVEYMNAVYQIYTTTLMEDIAVVLDDDAAVAKYQARYDELKARFFASWTDADGNLLSSRGTKTFNQLEVRDNAQTALLWALKLGLFSSDEHRETMLDNLVANIRNEGGQLRPGYAENTLSVGFLGVNVLLPVLADNGRADVAYDLLLQDAMPSWLYSVKNGATTVWERWNSYSIENSFGDASMNSFNHYSYGAAVEWMYKYIAGITMDESDPGFSSIVLQPTVDSSGRITRAEATYDSVHGPISASWKAAGGELSQYRVELPANTSAKLYLQVSAHVAKHLEALTPGLSYLGNEQRNGAEMAAFALESGSYELTDFAEPVVIPDTPTISGNAVVGETLTVDAGTWAPDDVTLAYQWLRDGKPIDQATGTGYTLSVADLGATISVSVSGTRTDYEPASVTSASTAKVAPASAPVATTVPGITGTPAVGSTLTASPGTWNTAGLAFGYQWLRNGQAIVGATAATYKVAAVDAGKKLSVRVTATKAGQEGGTATSAAVTAGKALTATPKPKITGTAKVGGTLKAKAGTWKPAKVSLKYQWLRDGVAIPGATKSSYKLVKADAGRTVSLKVTGSKSGYLSVAKVSSGRKIARYTAAVKLTLPASVARKKAATATVTVTAAVSRPVGTVKLTVDGRTVKTVLTAADNGKVKVVLPAISKKGSYKVKVSFTPGAPTNATTAASRTVTKNLKVR